MLNSIGTETERREKAHEKLKKATLGNRTPEELLEELKTLWKELDERDDGKKILGFYSALLWTLRNRLSNYPTALLNLVDAEERAKKAYRANEGSKQEARKR
ncbi:unnamed protein product [Zymoseptoria tritici ST99CH_3D7]|uniref:Uncharacterized protein n=1 Tax=Zymoseptoria tritici (strain ST99CH_3D7) TaxID=1276538 RepID=A0A1X7RZW8_ZYMT9|nr:unnamed protein product [Zymoseptoria tritici ST99CH_3D7]